MHTLTDEERSSLSDTENMASFEVDMLLCEMTVGETVQLTVQYNPSG